MYPTSRLHSEVTFIEWRLGISDFETVVRDTRYRISPFCEKSLLFFGISPEITWLARRKVDLALKEEVSH